ncbi:MAG: hypothetical protein ABW173_05890, partial [Sphingomonas sp.]
MTLPFPAPLALEKARPPRSGSGRALFWRLVWLYQGGCAAALVITLLLVLLGLELNPFQWGVLFGLMPPVVAIYNLSDVWLIGRHVKPVARALDDLDRDGTADEDVLAQGLVRALNLPFYSFMRVTFVHGPLVSILVCLSIPLMNAVVGAGF